MYIIMVYDIGVERVNKILKIGRMYLTWIQNSVFEGEITEADFIRLKEMISDVIDKDYDSVLFFVLTNKYNQKVVLGKNKNEPDVFI